VFENDCICGSSSIGRASAFQAEGRGFDSRLPLDYPGGTVLGFRIKCWKRRSAHVAQQVEHLLGKEEVTGSSPVVGSENEEENWITKGAWSWRRKNL
jgi:hypothetical protein